MLVHSYLSGELGQQNLTFFLESWQLDSDLPSLKLTAKAPENWGPFLKKEIPMLIYVSFREGTDRFYFFEHQKSQNCTSRI